MKERLSSLESLPVPADAWELLSPRLSDRRRDRMMQSARDRTRYLRLALQDVHDPHNIGACLRSAEAMGLLCADQVHLYQKFARASSVGRGADQWLELRYFRDIPHYASALKAKGYALAAAYPGGTSLNLEALPIDRPLALIFGNEHEGLHSSWLEHLDYQFTIPMYGLVESFNISVSVALSLYSLVQRMRKLVNPQDYFLPDAEQHLLLNQWVYRHAKQPDLELERLRGRLIS